MLKCKPKHVGVFICCFSGAYARSSFILSLVSTNLVSHLFLHVDRFQFGSTCWSLPHGRGTQLPSPGAGQSLCLCWLTGNFHSIPVIPVTKQESVFWYGKVLVYSMYIFDSQIHKVFLLLTRGVAQRPACLHLILIPEHVLLSHHLSSFTTSMNVLCSLPLFLSSANVCVFK